MPLDQTLVPATHGSAALTSVDVPAGRVTSARFPSGLRIPSHVHERPCLTIVLEGRFAEAVGGEERDCAKAGVLVKPGLERHSDSFADGGSRQLILEPIWDSELIRPCQAALGEVASFRDATAHGIGLRLAREIAEPDDLSALAVGALALELLVTVSRRAGGGRGGARPPAWLERARDMIHDCHLEDISLEDVAAAVGTHPAYLARLHARYFGESIGELVRRLRVETAAVELASSDKAIARIAFASGFSDQSHLTRLFKRYRGMTPGQYRRSVRS